MFELGVHRWSRYKSSPGGIRESTNFLGRRLQDLKENDNLGWSTWKKWLNLRGFNDSFKLSLSENNQYMIHTYIYMHMISTFDDFLLKYFEI